METVAQPPADAEIRLLTDWSEPGATPRRRIALGGTLLFHVVLIGGLTLAPPGFLTPPPRVAEIFHITSLVEPRLTDLTQKAPNKGRVTKEFEAPDLTPRARVQIPAGTPSTTRAEAPRPAVIPTPPAPLPEPPKLEASAEGPKPMPPPAAPPPRILPEEKPKLALENPASPPSPGPPGQGRVPIPNPSISNAIAQTLRGGGGGGVTVGDPGMGQGGYGEGISLPPAPGSHGGSLQLLSDPLGVDFRPYLIQILAAVKLHWLTVLPESVRMGRRGRVAIQFAIGRDGNVPKLVIASSSGADALDRAAVAGISASVPFPPLPTAYKGDQIRLQFNFAYNMPKQ
jgi:TonB family protein